MLSAAQNAPSGPLAAPLGGQGCKPQRYRLTGAPKGRLSTRSPDAEGVGTTISHLLAILDGLPQAEGTHWLNTQPDLHHITLDDSTTGWATNRTDDTDTGVCYDTSTHNWQIC
ncbi:hypothetical protein [Cutibacterium acnes]|uniref:hypothetical protein n=1 Tax=Cutibacterium acnes TaxID=1747 RepID=UPI0012FF360A|nr:hypothetical protein [Cutibacterium acnes]